MLKGREKEEEVPEKVRKVREMGKKRESARNRERHKYALRKYEVEE